MSDFYKRFLMEDVPRAVPGANKQVFLGAFGKHPGWDDHVEDLGLETFSLVEAKKLFYVQGIGGEIDSGAWEKLDESQRLPAFKHVFVWQRPGQYLIGRLWSSSDGKGRTRYPMVVCAHCAGVSLGWALHQVLPRLEQIEQACVTTPSAAGVRAILDQHRADLRAVSSGQTTDISPPSLDTAYIAKFAARPELGPQQEGWQRILYALQSQCGAFARGRFNSKSVASTIRPQHIRVPRAADSIPKAIVQWSGFFLTQLDPQTPLLLTVPLEEQWLDITLGEPASQEMFVLRATPKAMPLASEVPYNLTPEFRERARQLISTLEAGQPPASILSGGTEVVPASPAAPSTTRNRFFRWLGGGTALVAVAIAVTVALLPKPAGQTSSSVTAPVEPGPADVVSARPPSETRLPPAPPAADTVAARLTTEEKRPAEEKEKVAAAARLKAIADEQERIRVASETAHQRAAEEKRMAEQKRMAQEKARTEAPASTGPAPGDLALLRHDAATPAATQTVATASRPSPGRVHTNTVGMVFVQVPGGYWAGKYEVRQAEFQTVTGRNPSANQHPARPVESVNWEDAMEFCHKLTQREEAAGKLPKGWAYALPREAQWTEFAADASLNTGIASLQRKRAQSEPVGSGPANQLGLHDVRGNVWEWCLSTNDQKVLRGGAFDTIRGFAAAAQPHDYWKLPADQRRPQAGFRCVLVPGR